MKPRKLKSGKWNIQVYIGRDQSGKVITKSITGDTKDEVMYIAAYYKAKGEKLGHTSTIRQAVDNYITLSETLSPSTIHGYEVMKEYAFQSIMDLPISELTDSVLQNSINLEAKRTSRNGTPLSAKYVKNEWGLICAAIKSVDPDFHPHIKLPKIQKHIREYPEPADVLNAIIGSDIELPCLLAMWLSLTMSECRGLQYKDISNGFITINRVKVRIGNTDVVKSNAKTQTRLRRLKLPKYIQDIMPSGQPEAFIIDRSANAIYCRLRRILKNVGIEHISFHDLRHYSASIALMLNVPDKYIMERGGWATPNVMKSVYQNTYGSARESADNRIDEWFNSNIR